ncbi:MAG: zf-HC2 domain-containing protein [Gemmatimonadota bacterium]|nr:MAG: zf-HC2 domain-containing protein [Gemmatimonadota bacterium]
MTCKEVRALLSDYIDRELNVEILRDIDDHISDCTACSLQLEQLQKSLEILKRLRDKTPPNDFVDFPGQ